jgi:carbonic anhydrase
MKRFEEILLENKAWATEKLQEDPNFFLRMKETQKPEFLWIGCSDSRVSPTEITQTKPGEIFIHRNVANLVVHTDLNLLSVMQYAVEVLKIKHVIVCGHYGCGGVRAAMTHQSFGIINKWLRHIKDVYRLHQQEIEAVEGDEARADKLVECNVREQVYNVAKTTIIQQAWKNDQRPYLHGWVYDMESGLLKQVLEMPPNSPLDHHFYEFDWNEGAA